MKTIRNEIIQEAIQHFIRYSIGSVSVKKLTDSLHISNQDFYYYFKDKKDLIKQVVDFRISEGQKFITQLQVLELPPHIEIKCFFAWLAEQIALFPVRYFSDLKELYPDIYGHQYEAVNNILFTFLSDNIKAGCRLDMYRKNINFNLLIEIFTGYLHNLLQNEFTLSYKRNEWANVISWFCSNLLEQKDQQLNTASYLPDQE